MHRLKCKLSVVGEAVERDRSGPSVEPCGTLDSRSMTSDAWQLAVTENVRPATEPL